MCAPFNSARKGAIIAAAVALPLAGFLIYFTSRTPSIPMERYVPRTALAMIEVNSLTDLVGGLARTQAWRELAPLLGVSRDLARAVTAADLSAMTGFGTIEARVASRAQIAAAITAIEAEAGEEDQGPYVHFRPRFALIVETHSGEAVARQLIDEFVPGLARRIYGDEVSAREEILAGSRVAVYEGARPGRNLLAAAAGSIVVIANHRSALSSCLDTINGNAPGLDEDPTLQVARAEVASDASVFAFVSQQGIESLAEFGPAVIAGRLSTDPDQIGAVAGVFGNVTKQTVSGFLYSLTFGSNHVGEKYLTVLDPGLADAIATPLRAGDSNDITMAAVVPADVKEATFLNVERVGELPERLLRQVSARLDVVAGLALREFVMAFRRGLGIEGDQSLGDAVGDELALVKFGDDEPTAMFVKIADRDAIQPVVERYVTGEGDGLRRESAHGVEILQATNDDQRAAAFVDDCLVLATAAQLEKIIGAVTRGAVLSADAGFAGSMSRRPSGTSVISFRRQPEGALETVRSLARLLGGNDSSDTPEAEIAGALERLAPNVSFTRFRPDGVYTESQSAVGNLALIGSFTAGD